MGWRHGSVHGFVSLCPRVPKKDILANLVVFASATRLTTPKMHIPEAAHGRRIFHCKSYTAVGYDQCAPDTRSWVPFFDMR